MNNKAVKSGVILGVIFIVISLVVYLINYTLMIRFWYFVLLIPIISVGVTSYLGITERKEMGNYLSFGKSYIFSIICIVTAFAISTVFSILMNQVIDPELPRLLTDASEEYWSRVMRNFGSTQEQIDEQIEKIREDTAAGLTVSGQIRGFFTASLIFAAILSVISALFIKKKEPEFGV